MKLATAHVPPMAPSLLFYPHPLLSRRSACQHSRPCEVTSSWLPGVWGHLPGVLCGCQEPIHSSWPLPGKNRRHCPSLTAVRNEVLRREEGGKPSLGNTMGNLSVLLGRWRAPQLGQICFHFPEGGAQGFSVFLGAFTPAPPSLSTLFFSEASCLGL